MRNKIVPWLPRSMGWLLLVLLAVFGFGCQTLSFYHQAVRGQLQILSQREQIPKLIERQTTAEPLQQKLQLVLDLREFARTNLHLPVDEQYACYVDLHRRYAVWNVHAAPEFSLIPKTWRYPVVGRLKYRGYFLEEAARRYGHKLGEQGWDVYVYGVEAYSTLGWFKDPVLSTFINREETDLAEILFHELAHQELFVRDDTDFNEAFATAVAEEGVRRWLLATGKTNQSQAYAKGLQRNSQFVELILETRRQLKKLYGDPDDDEKKRSLPRHADAAAEIREMKQRIMEQLRTRYQELRSQWNGYSGYDHWFTLDMNNAQLNTVATYYRLVPSFHQLLATNEGDLARFYRDVKALARRSKSERQEELRRLTAVD